MGGKNKQRTKGNVRPSSSGRAAEVLTREGGVIPGFVGFGSAVTSELSYVPAVHGAEDIDNLVDADFRLVLRKLSKRDVVTRLKAVQDFGSMCQERDAEEVKGVLPYWPRIYCKISVDHDRRIREATQQAFEQLVLKVRRSLAPFLKSLMGHWILSQCDTYTPAASAACQAFQAAFSPTKQPEALSFCKDEILSVLQDIFLASVPIPLTVPLTILERDTKYVRMLTSSLLGVKRLLSLLLPEDRVALEEKLAHLVNSGKFWKYSKHKTPQVRGAFFEMVCALCEFTPGLVQAEAARLCPTVLLSIDDTDPVVLPPVWEAVLHVVSTIPDCWTHVNAKKGFLPKLWALLKEGGKGMAKALHPNLMPLLSKLPPQVTDPNLDFYTTFFTAFVQGPHLSWILLLNPSLQNGPLFLLGTEMLISWEKRAGLHSEGEANDNKDVFQRLLVDFWEDLGLLLVRYVDNEDADPQALEGVASLLQVSLHFFNIFPPQKFSVLTLRIQQRVNKRHVHKKKSVRMCFSKPEDNEKTGVEGDGVEKLVQTVSELVNEKAFGSLQTQHFEDVVCQLAQLCLVHVNEKNSERHLVFLSLLLRSFHTSRVFSVSHATPDNSILMSLVFFFFFFFLNRSSGSYEQICIVNSNIKFTLLEMSVLFCYLSCQACTDPETLQSCSDWLKGSVLGEQLLGLTEELCKVGSSSYVSTSSTSSHSWTLISLVLSQRHNNESLIGEVYMEKILEKLHTTLLETKSLSDAGNMEPLISFICDVASTFFSSVQDCLLLVSAEELLLTVFQLTAQDQTHTHMSDSLLDKLKKVCAAGVQSLVQHCDYEVTEGGFLHSAAVWVTKQLLTVSLDIKGLQVLVLAVQSLVETIISVCDRASDILIQFFTFLMPSQTEWTRIRLALPLQVCKSIQNLYCWKIQAMLHNCYGEVVKKGLYCNAYCTQTFEIHVLFAPLFCFLQWIKTPLLSNVYGCLAVLLCCLQANTHVEEEVVLAILATVMEWRNSREDWFLFSSDISKATAEQLNLSVEIMRFLSWLVTHCPTVLGGSQWDFLLCSMLAWLETASENVSSLWNPWVQLFVCENAALIVKLNQFFTSSSSELLEKLPSELAGEWTDFFIEGIYNLLLPLPVKITDDPLFPMAVLQSVGMALIFVPVPQLNQNSLPPRFIADQKTNLPEPLQTLLNTFCPLLLFKARPLQITVYHLLEKVMPQLPECDGEEDSNKSDDDRDEPCLSPPASLMAILSTCEELCDNILAAVQVGEFAVVQPLSVEYSCILGYLLTWKLLLTFFKSSPSHLRAHYAQYLKRSCSLNKLLLHLFKLMPENPVYPSHGSETRETKTFFTEGLFLAVNSKQSTHTYTLPHLACSVYYSTVQDLPAMVRLWWNSQEKRVSAAVEKFTIKYVSPVLSAQEISSVHTSTQMFDSMTVKARSAAREVIATYSVDDIFIELVIQLPQNYPLGSITVESGRRVGVAVQQWRNWMLQLSTYLTHQNGSIMEGLALWKNNVDKRFEGIEDCMICFSVIHGSNYSLPKKACRTCKKKFHSACLYKWFTSSNKSTCPLCRETFF
uniref:E3 ubiquitin-protein ligase listerin n=1 Tax=Amphiprion ocellaris TaxID=80972 RepID=A0AAQ5Z1H0_AMPOC